jgi:ketosteroid isomerase-like protein
MHPVPKRYHDADSQSGTPVGEPFTTESCFPRESDSAAQRRPAPPSAERVLLCMESSSPRRDTAWAMSKETVGVVQAAADAFARDGVDGWLEYFTDDVDYRAAEGAIDDRGPIHGKDALRAYAEDWTEMFDDVRFEPVEVIDAGDDTVIAVMRISGRPKGTSAEALTLSVAGVSTIRDGKIARSREYWTREEALEAAGLSE